MIFEGRIFRNLQEQVAYLTAYLDTLALGNEFGITVLGRVDTFADLPANDPDDPFSYGDAYMVGQEGHTPYRMAIWTRNADGYGNPGWFDIGYFPTAPDEFSIVEVNGEPVHIFDADTKLDKQTGVTTYAQVYSKAADGTQENVPYSSSSYQYHLVQRAVGGQINVPQVPTEDGHATAKKYVDDNFLQKSKTSSSSNQVYGRLTDGTQFMFPLDINTSAHSVVRRATAGQINAPDQISSPPTDDQFISKKYADAHYGSGLVHYLHSVKVELTLASGDIYPFRIDYIDTSSTPVTSFKEATGKLMTVYPDGQGEHSDNTAFDFTVRLTTGTLNPYGLVGNGFILEPTNDAEVYIGGVQSTAISSQSVVDTVSQL